MTGIEEEPLSEKAASAFSRPVMHPLLSNSAKLTIVFQVNETANPRESFEQFKKSFSYGSRNDLNFKFLAGLSDGEAAHFLQDLLWKLGDTIDDQQWERIIDHVIEGQIRGYSGPARYSYDDGPFANLRKSLSQSTLALITSSGHFVEGNDPEPFGIANMSQQEAVRRIDDFLKAEPTLSEIPTTIPIEKLRVRHGGYDVQGSLADPNTSFPLERLRELEEEGIIGRLSASAYSFVGACAQTRLLKHSCPQWTDMLKQQEIDVALLVPV